MQGPAAGVGDAHTKAAAPVHILASYARSGDELDHFEDIIEACAPAKPLEWEDAIGAVSRKNSMRCDRYRSA